MSLVASTSVKNITRDPSRLSESAKRFHDPGDIRQEGTVTFKAGEFTNFIIGRIIAGLTSQPGVKHLMPIEEGFKYLATVGDPRAEVRGHCQSIDDGIIHLPINQSLEIGTIFSLSVSNLNGTKAITVLSDKLTPITGIPPNLLPFNRRIYLLHVLPNEILDAKFHVTTTSNFSVMEMTHFSRPEDNVLIFGTQLNTHPNDIMKRVAVGIRSTVEDKVNNKFDAAIRASGYTDNESAKIKLQLEATLKALESKW